MEYKTLLAVLVTALITSLGQDLYKYIKNKGRQPLDEQREIRQKLDLVCDAQLCTTRQSLIHLCEKFINRGEIPIYQLDCINKMYQAYHNLGGNGTITELVEAVRELPIQNKGEKI